jgi:hypothetical protein
MPEAAEAADVTQPVEETSQRQRNASELLSELNGACFHRIEASALSGAAARLL